MENIPSGKFDKQGCFVYHVVAKVEVCTSINVEDTRNEGCSFEPGQLVSVDVIRHSRIPSSNNGPFLRLTDNKGWVFEKKYGKRLLEQLVVEIDLWCFVVDNYNKGMALRNHPFDGSDRVDPEILYRPSQKIYCDRRVVHPVTGVMSYRVQGTTGWVFSKRIRENGIMTCMMLPEFAVQTGLFAFELLDAIAVRPNPCTASGELEDLRGIVWKAEVVCCDVIRQTHPPDDRFGPFLRLADGSGWIFSKKPNTAPLVRSIPIVDGRWLAEILNEPGGLALRRQPIDRDDMKTGMIYPPGERVYCDRKITSNGISFYRVIGEQGWLCDQCNGKSTLKLSNCPGVPLVTHKERISWDVEFVRGLALAYDLKEIVYNETSRIISFETEYRETIHVYFTTRTVGCTIYLPTQGKTQLFRRNCTDQELKEILKDIKSLTGKNYQKREMTPYGEGAFLDEERDCRQTILRYDSNIAKLTKQRNAMLKSVQHHDKERAAIAAKMFDKVVRYEDEVAQTQTQKRTHLAVDAAEAERQRREETALLQQQKKELQQQIQELQASPLTCGECHAAFSDEYALHGHCRDVHGLQCGVCSKIFRSKNLLNNHCKTLGHYY